MLLVFTKALKGVGFNFKMWESQNLQIWAVIQSPGAKKKKRKVTVELMRSE